MFNSTSAGGPIPESFSHCHPSPLVFHRLRVELAPGDALGLAQVEIECEEVEREAQRDRPFENGAGVVRLSREEGGSEGDGEDYEDAHDDPLHDVRDP